MTSGELAIPAGCPCFQVGGAWAKAGDASPRAMVTASDVRMNGRMVDLPLEDR